jgi:hypothetical protein
MAATANIQAANAASTSVPALVRDIGFWYQARLIAVIAARSRHADAAIVDESKERNICSASRDVLGEAASPRSPNRGRQP